MGTDLHRGAPLSDGPEPTTTVLGGKFPPKVYRSRRALWRVWRGYLRSALVHLGIVLVFAAVMLAAGIALGKLALHMLGI